MRRLIQQHGRWLLALATLAGVLLFVLWPTRAEQAEAATQDSARSGAGSHAEPITPIPITTPQNPELVALGRQLFADARLSPSGHLACTSCHDLNHGGTNRQPLALDAQQHELDYNAPTVFNATLNLRPSWTGKVETLRDFLDQAGGHMAYLGAPWSDLEPRLTGLSGYSRSLNRDLVLDALTHYVQSLTTPNARFDRYLRGDAQALSADELAGYRLFKNLGCIACHQGVNVGGNMYAKLGQMADYPAFTKADMGRFNLTGKAADRQYFRVPTLRNVALTAPYFHDGSAQTLEQAVSLMAYFQLGVRLSEVEVTQLVAFLNSLTGELPSGSST